MSWQCRQRTSFSSRKNASTPPSSVPSAAPGARCSQRLRQQREQRYAQQRADRVADRPRQDLDAGVRRQAGGRLMPREGRRSCPAHSGQRPPRKVARRIISRDRSSASVASRQSPVTSRQSPVTSSSQPWKRTGDWLLELATGSDVLLPMESPRTPAVRARGNRDCATRPGSCASCRLSLRSPRSQGSTAGSIRQRCPRSRDRGRAGFGRSRCGRRCRP